MNCYNHHSAPAIGICKNCNKGLCPDCATEVENGIACANCTEEVRALNNLIQNNKKAATRTASVFYRNAIVYFLMGCVFIGCGIAYTELKNYMLPCGAIFFIGGLLSLNSARKYK